MLDTTVPPGAGSSPYSSADELFLHHPVPMWVHDCDTLHFLAVNDAAVEQYGYTREQFLTMSLPDLEPGFTLAQPSPLASHPGRRRRWRQYGVTVHRRANGSIVHAELIAHDLTFDGRHAVAVAAYDITGRLIAEAASREKDRQLQLTTERLVESESRYRELVENLDDVVFVVDATGLIQFTSPAVSHYGYEALELVGRPFTIVVHPDDRSSVLASFADTLAGSRLKRQFRVLDKDGQTHHVRTSHRVTWRDGVPVSLTGVLIDITEQVRAQEQLQSAGRIEAVGRLAGGIAHDFNNLLVAIMGFADMAYASLPDDSPVRSDISEIMKAGQRAASLTGQLLAFSRRQVLRPDSVRLCDVVHGMEPMLRRLIGEDIDLVIDCDESLGPVRIDPGQMEQVIMNLAVNARDAMPGGGMLRIRTGRTGFPPAHLPQGFNTPEAIVLSVSDTGVGMDAATQARIFEPFFTTKPVGRGTGLGLAMVYGFVQQSGGAIAVQSTPGMGTTFRIALPEDQTPELTAAEAAPAVTRGAGTVLVAEDEPTVRGMVQRILESAGYRVLSAESGPVALQLCRTHPGTIDLLLTDVVMPHMSGTALAGHASELRPGMAVLFMSGYSGPDVAARGLGDEPSALLQKPFTAGQLSSAVRAAMLTRTALRINA